MTSGRMAALLLAATFAALGAMVPFRTSPRAVWGDEGTYLAMAESLVHDGDLRFDQRDRGRLEALGPEDTGADTVILQRDEDGTIAYSKPVLYPLLAAPFVALFGRAGPIILNAIALAFALALAHHDLRRRAEAGHAHLVLVTFLGAGVVLPYVLWRMSDILQLSLVLAGLVLTLRPSRQDETATGRRAGWADRLVGWAGAPYFGAVLLGAAVTLRINNLALAAVPVLAAILLRDLRRAAKLAAATALAAAVYLGFGTALTGAPLPYRAERSSFTHTTGYPSQDDARVEEAFAERPARHHTGILPAGGVDRSAYAAAYFLIGRHSGLLIYFPAALVLLGTALRHRDAAGLAALAGFGAATVFFLLWMPWNYFGGNTFLGNRYLLSAYPALLLAPRRLPSPRALAVAWLLAALGYGSAWWSVKSHRDIDRSSQSHARAGVFRLLPYESTARDLSGRDRYWGDLFVRFVDPFAAVGPWHFELVSGLPPAELLVAQWQEPGTLRLLVETERPGATLVFRDWRHEARYALSGEPNGVTVVDLAPAAAWRRHRFWWHPTQRYDARTMRLGIESPDGLPVRAQVRLLGDPRRLEEAFAYARETVAVPETATAGSRSTVSLRITNTSHRTWRGSDVTPVFARYRLSTAQTGDEVAGPAVPLSGSVEPDEKALVDVSIDWPSTPGDYQLEIDLVLGHVGTFASRLGAPVVEAAVRVEAAGRVVPAGRVEAPDGTIDPAASDR